MYENSVVWVVDDDDALRASLVWLFNSAGYTVEACSNPQDFLSSYDADRAGVLVLDLQMPGMSGLELVRKLRAQNCLQPFIVISGHGDVTSAVDLMQEGAIDFLEKPFDHSLLLEYVDGALQRHEETRERRLEEADIRERINSLTPRELVVMHMVVDGMLTKQIAQHLGISQKTVEVHRSHMTKKMQVSSVAQLVRAVVSLSPTASGASDLGIS